MTTCLIQARMRSSRFPGKVLQDFLGRPMLAFIIHRLRSAHFDDLVVATSTRPEDDIIEQVSLRERAEVYRGSETDVLDRMYGAARAFPANHLVRITADCPLLDPRLARLAVDLLETSRADYVSNSVDRTFPDGEDVEAFTFSALEKAARDSQAPEEREHVTPYLFRHPGRFKLRALRQDEDLSSLRWTVDTPSDLARVRQLAAELPNSDFTWQEVLRLCHVEKLAYGFAIRNVKSSDSLFLFSLRSEADAIRFSPARKLTPDRHQRWFMEAIQGLEYRIWVATVDDVPVGYVRVQVSAGVGAVSVAVTPAQRRKGYAERLLGHVKDVCSQDMQLMGLTADIHEANTGSIRVFERSGFRRQSGTGRYHIYGWQP